MLKRERAIAIAALVLLCALAWGYTIAGAGLGMSAWDMTGFAWFPHRMGMGDAFEAHWSLAAWVLIVAMWWVMMIAMMTPSAAPAILLYAKVYQHTSAQSKVLAPTGAFAAGYLLVWLVFSLAAALLHWALDRSGLVAAMMMGSRSRSLSAGLLIAAGIYQLSPLKRSCLAQCRAPASFLSRHWRPHIGGALRLGVIHGAYCVGCCGVLMALLFVGGVMNLVWIAALTALVLIEKAVPGGQWVARGTGVALIFWGAVTLLI